MKTSLAYGSGQLPLQVPDGAAVVEPAHVAGLADERAAVQAALEHPIAAESLRERIGAGAKVCITFTDITRATPNERIIPWLLDYLAFVPDQNIVLVNQVGTHRPNTREELARLLTPQVLERYRVINHDPEDPSELRQVGTMSDGTAALISRHLVEADVRIITGFIEPHFFAGFSGGPKGIIPGCAGLASVMSNHGVRHIASPEAAFGTTFGNPLWEELREVALRVGPSFLLNVALNQHRQITGVFAGDLIEAHRVGCAFVKQTAMRAVAAPFDLVLTSNSGYPLDLNLYQGVKGLSAAARITRLGGTIILACECREGVPAGSPFERLLLECGDPGTLLHRLTEAAHPQAEQWQVQILAQILCRHRVRIHSRLPEAALRRLGLESCAEPQAEIDRLLRDRGASARIAVLPYGPLTIPYLEQSALAETKDGC